MENRNSTKSNQVVPPAEVQRRVMKGEERDVTKMGLGDLIVELVRYPQGVAQVLHETNRSDAIRAELNRRGGCICATEKITKAVVKKAPNDSPKVVTPAVKTN